MELKVLQWHWGFFVEVWKLFKKHNSVREDEEWDRLIREATELRERYPGDFSEKIIMAVLDELDRRCKYD